MKIKITRKDIPAEIPGVFEESTVKVIIVADKHLVDKVEEHVKKAIAEWCNTVPWRNIC